MTKSGASVANCGTSEINSYWEYNRPGRLFGSFAMPNSVRLGIDTHDFIGKIAPRAYFPDFVTFLSSKIRMPDFHQYRQIQG